MKRIIVTFWVIAAAMLALAYAGPAVAVSGYPVTPTMVKQFNRGFQTGWANEGIFVTYQKCSARNYRRIVSCQYLLTVADENIHASVRLTRPKRCIAQATLWIDSDYVRTMRQRIC